MTVKVSKPAVNLREELADLRKPTGIAGETMLRAETPQEQFNLIGAGRRNLIINGDFRISQRGSFTTATAVSSTNYYLDRWKMDMGSVSATLQNNSDVDLPNGITVKTVKISATTSATGYLQMQQKIEVEDYMDNREVIISAWVKSNTPFPRLRVESATVGLGSADGTQTHSGSGEWEYLTMKLTTGNSLANFAVGVIDWAGGATRAISSGDYFEVANIQCELGKVATPFEHRSYGDELARCQRYFHRIERAATGANTMATGAVTPTGGIFYIQFPTSMRASPSVTKTGTSYSMYSTASGSQASISNFSITFGPFGTLGGRFLTAKVGDAGNSAWIDLSHDNTYFSFDAEL